MPVVRDVLMMFVMVGKRMSSFSKRSMVGMGSSSQDTLGGCTVDYFKNKFISNRLKS